MIVLPEWVFDLRERIPALLEDCSAGPPGWYRLCTRGDLLRPSPHAGLGFSCYAAKIMVECGLWDSLPSEHREAWIRHIQSFQLDAGHPGHGMFRDPWVELRGMPRNIYGYLHNRHWRDLFHINWQNRWAESRQAVSTLFAVDAQPRSPISGFPIEPDEIRVLLDSLNWRHPWGAGAQVGHLLFFLRHTQVSETEKTIALDTILEFLASIKSCETGGWYRSNVANQEIINGAMKIISGLAWWDIPVQYPEVLARSAVASTNAAHDCALANRLFVLYHLQKQLKTTLPGVEAVVEASLRSASTFIQADGGISSTPDRSLRVYYGAGVSKGYPVGDLHGLMLLSWAITLGAHLVGKQDQLGWRLVAP